MNHILIVAAREFRQIAAARSFWVTLLIIPFALAVGPIASHFMQRPDTETVMLIDGDGEPGRAVRHRILIDEQRRTLEALNRYAARYDLSRAAPGALWARPGGNYTDAEVDSFARSGGVNFASTALHQAAAPGTPAFEPPAPLLRLVPTPATLAKLTPDQLGRALPALINPPKDSGAQKLDNAVYIPAELNGPAQGVQVWADGQPSNTLMDALQSELTRTLRIRFLEVHGVNPAIADAAGQIAPAIRVNAPPAGQGHDRVVIRSIVPLLASYLLLMSLMMSGSWMLQGTVEERSNKLIETVLACISPNELMYGKLIGTVAVGLTMIAFWVLCAVAAAFATQGMIAEFLRPALAPLAAPGVALAIGYFFIAGYLMVSMIFLSIGAMSDSFRDAQSYLTPVLLVITLPFAIVAQAILNDPFSLGVRIMSWIPIYTPFTMLARMGAGVPTWEMVGSGLMLAAFVAIEVVLLGRVFRASLLTSGSKPGLGQIGRLMLGRQPE